MLFKYCPWKNNRLVFHKCGFSVGTVNKLETQPLYKFNGYPPTLQVLSLVAEVRPKVVGCASKTSQDQTYLGGLSCRMCMASIMKDEEVYSGSDSSSRNGRGRTCCGCGVLWCSWSSVSEGFWNSDMYVSFTWRTIHLADRLTRIFLWSHEPSNHPSSQSPLWPCLRSCRGYPATGLVAKELPDNVPWKIRRQKPMTPSRSKKPWWMLGEKQLLTKW